MTKKPRILGIHAEPTLFLKILLGLLPFLLIVIGYMVVSHKRTSENPNDKLTPSISKMAESTRDMALVPDRGGVYMLWADTVASLKRILAGLLMAALVGLLIGLNTGAWPGLDVTLQPLVRFLSIIPPLAILPILFIAFGVGELGKVMLIFLGSVFIISRDIHQAVLEIPREQIVKALTLGASPLQTVYEIILPQVLPRLFATVRLCLGGCWLFLIASEAIAATEGLGYRIFLVRRYLAMDIIIPYVLWTTLLGFAMDNLIRVLGNWLFPWYAAKK